jgi:hypothetical protein
MEIPKAAFQVIDLNTFYWVAGLLIVTNIGTVGTILFTMGRALWWVAKLDSRVEKNSKDVDSAHQGIRDIKLEIRSFQRPN